MTYSITLFDNAKLMGEHIWRLKKKYFRVTDFACVSMKLGHFRRTNYELEKKNELNQAQNLTNFSTNRQKSRAAKSKRLAKTEAGANETSNKRPATQRGSGCLRGYISNDALACLLVWRLKTSEADHNRC